jgi:3-hydroxyisobutyrate dehydrogenase-like beta-hydroxyacid dehydrogenase
MWWDGLQDVGFIGLGNMGGHMASNLLKAGHRLTVHDRYVTFSTEAQMHMILKTSLND